MLTFVEPAGDLVPFDFAQITATLQPVWSASPAMEDLAAQILNLRSALPGNGPAFVLHDWWQIVLQAHETEPLGITSPIRYTDARPRLQEWQARTAAYLETVAQGTQGLFPIAAAAGLIQIQREADAAWTVVFVIWGADGDNSYHQMTPPTCDENVARQWATSWQARLALTLYRGWHSTQRCETAVSAEIIH